MAEIGSCRLRSRSGKTSIRSEDYDLNQHFGYAAWTANSHVAQHGDARGYLCGRRKPGFEISARGEGEDVESLMLESDYGLIWRKRAVFQETVGDEIAFLFESVGSVLAVVDGG